MYINLGSTKIKYPEKKPDDFMIFAEIPDSQVGYEKPILVRTSDELDIWFGTDYPGYDYHQELLESEVTLLMMRPISEVDNYYQEGYISYKDFIIVPELFNSLTELPDTGAVERLYRVYNQGGLGVWVDPVTKLTYDEYIWLPDLGNYINTDLLPQNIEVNSESSVNRDTLDIYAPVEGKLNYSHPKFLRKPRVSFPLGFSPSELVSYLGDIERGYKTIAYNLDYSGAYLRDGSYLIAKDSIGTAHLLYFGESIPNINPTYYKTTTRVDTIPELLLKLGDLGYKIEDNLMVAPNPEVSYFYNIPGFNITPNYEETHAIIAEHHKGQEIISFWSKTIGYGGPDGNIQITIEDLGGKEYRVTIKRFNYTEVFEGSTEYASGKLRIDNKISRESRLVYCKLAEDFGGTGKENIPSGTWNLRGAIKEQHNSSSYNKALQEIKKGIGNTFPDYFLIPNIGKFVSNEEDSNTYLTTYSNLLQFAKDLSCQVLIENSYIGDTGRENYLYNYLGDTYNRLVYFYHGMSISGNPRPGYYLFLRGLLTDIYAIDTSIALYDSPIKKPYDNIVSELDKYKTNYLIDNGITYYYKNYQVGKNYTTTVWMRFVLDKISRELEKNKWDFLAQHKIGHIENKIKGILGRVRNSFGIIRSLTITNLDYDLVSEKVSVSINTSISDLVGNDITLDVTLNYN